MNLLQPKNKKGHLSIQRKRSGGILKYFFLVFLGLTGVIVVNDCVIYLDLRRSLCENGMTEEARTLLNEPRHLTSTIVAYIDAIVNGSEDPCKTTFPNAGLFLEYPPVVYDEGDGIVRRPVGTIAYVVTITRCPEMYAPGVDETPDPGPDLYEVTAIIKDEICNATETLNMLSQGSDSQGSDSYTRDQTLYSIVNPNGVTCGVPGSISQYDRVAMLKDMGYRVEIVGQPITNTMLLENQPYINEHIESDVGIRDSTKLHVFSMVEHPVAILYNFDCIFHYRVIDIVKSLEGDPNLKGYYVKKAPCDDEGNAVVDTGFMVIKPSIEEYNNIISTYINTPYDPVLGWNSDGHNKCGGKLGLPGFFSYYFSITPGYQELDRCKYSFVADDECIAIQVQEDAKTSLEIADSLNVNSTDSPSTPEGIAANEAAQSTVSTIDQVRVMEVNKSNPQVSAQIIEEESMVIMEVYVMVMVSVRMMVRTTNSEGEVTYSMIMSNNYMTERSMVEQISIDPSLIQAPQIVEDPVADAFVSTAVTRPIVARQSTDICGNPTDCPPDYPNWSRSQQLACQELHSNHFLDRRRTELSMDKIELSALIGQFKPRSFHGYCTAAGPDNYIGLKDTEIVTAPSWQVVCEPMVCPYGSYVTQECTCSNVDDPCSACPSGTRCQKSPVLTCIDCRCGMCGRYNDACCQSNGTNECAIGNGSNECSLENQFFAAVAGTGSSCSNSVNMGVTSTPPGCGCDPSRAAPCSFDPSLQQSDLSCFMCSAKDLADGVCPRCTQCLGSKNNCINTSQTEEAYKSCLALISDTDRNNCHDQCTKW